MKVRFRFLRSSFLFGIQWNRPHRRLVVIPMPCIGIEIQIGTPPARPSKEAAIAAMTLRSLAGILRKKSGGRPVIDSVASGDEITAAVHFTQVLLADQLDQAANQIEAPHA